MDEPRTKWEQLQSRFKNSWFGIIVLALIALAVFLSQVGDATKKVIDWIRPLPAADLWVQPMPPRIEPLEQFRELVKSAGPDTIYAVGATFHFGLQHDGTGEEVISINSLDVRVDAYDPRAGCPYTLTGDRIFGAGEAPLRVFDVRMSRGRVEAVQRKDQRNGPIMRGRSNNLLDIEPPLPLVLRKTEIEKIIVTFIVDDAGRYRIGLSIRYTNRNGPKTAEIPSVAICKPQE